MGAIESDFQEFGRSQTIFPADVTGAGPWIDRRELGNVHRKNWFPFLFFTSPSRIFHCLIFTSLSLKNAQIIRVFLLWLRLIMWGACVSGLNKPVHGERCVAFGWSSEAGKVCNNSLWLHWRVNIVTSHVSDEHIYSFRVTECLLE